VLLNYSENQLTALAQINPKELARILTSSNMDVATLTFGAEILGTEVADEAIVLPVIKVLLKHINAIVREGAVIGASSFWSGKKPPREILDRLKVMANSDPSSAIREVVRGVLEDMESIALG
jgi:hypothetical protein